jgi:hypothetical protein
VEIQALVAPTTLGTPRRAVVGWDPSRLSMVLAVLEAHCGVRLSGHDVYLNVAGGLRIQEPAADVAAAAALVSSLAHAPLPADAVYFGEVSLSGAVRPVAQTAARLKEAQKLGFTKAIVPEAARNEAPTASRSATIGTLAISSPISPRRAPALRRVGRQDGADGDVGRRMPVNTSFGINTKIGFAGNLLSSRRRVTAPGARLYSGGIFQPQHPFERFAGTMPITLLDIVLIVVMLISGLLAMVRGFMREVLSITAWVLAAGATLYAYPSCCRSPSSTSTMTSSPPSPWSAAYFWSRCLSSRS